MLTIDAILSPTQRKEFDAIVRQAVSQGAQAVRYYKEEGGLIVIALLTEDGDIRTWFAGPACNAVEAYAAQQVILLGLQAATDAMAGLLSGAKAFANEAIRKAAH